ncbi:MAG: hypothetical protein ACI8PZ_004995 [Myxococcota bacterium]|jgi:hypothetical protein
MSDGTDGGGSRRRRAAQRLLGAAASALERARDQAQDVRLDVVERATSTADMLLMESQQVTYAELHRRFTERAERGEGGLVSAIEALDAMWENIRQLRAGAHVILGTLSSTHASVQDRRSRFVVESTAMLEDAIRTVFAEDLGHLAVPPERMAVLVRILLEGLVVELAQARTPADVREVDQAYADMRALFQRFVLLGGEAPLIEAVELEPIALPW